MYDQWALFDVIPIDRPKAQWLVVRLNFISVFLGENIYLTEVAADWFEEEKEHV